eukprot:TRINITY_DN63616_c0_g4_i1.p1 TRINITY_DN63616_c0_g4~~TRINITY_DN63616_c0_g4_i1.p1  ORF type:complete len:322 (+),score=28.88 TRINITY_DN63616_c0_g4_i1:47-1012(+)
MHKSAVFCQLIDHVERCTLKEMQHTIAQREEWYNALETVEGINNNQDAVWLTVGDKSVYHTTLATLTVGRDSMFTAWLQSSFWSANEDEDGYLAVDGGNGALFRDVLAWLRGKQKMDESEWIACVQEDDEWCEAIENEARYYGLDKLVEEINDILDALPLTKILKWNVNWKNSLQVSDDKKTVESTQVLAGHAMCSRGGVNKGCLEFQVTIDSQRSKNLYSYCYVGVACEHRLQELREGASTLGLSCTCGSSSFGKWSMPDNLLGAGDQVCIKADLAVGKVTWTHVDTGEVLHTDNSLAVPKGVKIYPYCTIQAGGAVRFF